MKTIAGIIFALFVLLVVCLMCANAVNAAEPLPVNTFLQAITMDTSDGKELERKNVSGPWDEPTCWVKQQASVPTIQHPKDGKITVYMCTALGAGDLAT